MLLAFAIPLLLFCFPNWFTDVVSHHHSIDRRVDIGLDVCLRTWKVFSVDYHRDTDRQCLYYKVLHNGAPFLHGNVSSIHSGNRPINCVGFHF